MHCCFYSPAECDGGMEYTECGSLCPQTCERLFGTEEDQLLCPTVCVPGCFCPNDLVLHNGQCTPPSQCPSEQLLAITLYWRAGASQPSRSFERNFLFICRRTSCKCACAASNALLFIRNNFQIFTHFHTRRRSIDLASPTTLLHSTACSATFGD